MLIPNPKVRHGEILWAEFMETLGLMAGKLAKALPRSRSERLVAQKTALTMDSALRPGRYFGTDAAFWLNLTNSYDAALAQRDPDLTRALAGIIPLRDVQVRAV